MGLSGTLQTMPLVDLLQWFSSASKTGTLSVRGVKYTKRIYVKQGRIISSSSDDPTEQLGQFLLSRGHITEEQLRKGLDTQAKTHVLLGKILLMVGAFSEDQLKRLLVMKSEETIFSLFLLSDAHFEFKDGELPAGLFVPISLDVQDVLLKGLTMIDELRHIRSEFGSTLSIVGRTNTPLPDGYPADQSVGRAVLSLVDGRRSVADICLTLHSSEFTICQLLYQFYEQGYVVLVEKKVTKPGVKSPADRPFVSAGALVQQGKSRLAQGQFDAAVDLLQQAVTASPGDLKIKELYDDASARFRQQADEELLPSQSVPVLVRAMNQLTNESLTPEEVFLISRINGSWNLKSIIDISPLGEVEALRIVKRLKDRGIIQLKR